MLSHFWAYSRKINHFFIWTITPPRIQLQLGLCAKLFDYMSIHLEHVWGMAHILLVGSRTPSKVLRTQEELPKQYVQGKTTT